MRPNVVEVLSVNSIFRFAYEKISFKDGGVVILLKKKHIFVLRGSYIF